MTVQLRRITDPADLADVDALYRDVFHVAADDTGLNQRLLMGLIANSGHLIGAYEEAGLVGFGLSFLGRDRASGRLYHYSQTVAVAEKVQGRGVGRAVKCAQRQAALDDGVDLMRWSFDPMHARNAHFNLDVLGARAHRLHRDLYGDAAPGRDAGERTDRLVVDWELTAPHPEDPPPPDLAMAPGSSTQHGGLVAVAMPADWTGYRAAHGTSVAAKMREDTVAAIQDALGRGLVAYSCRRTSADVAVYLFGANV